MDAAALHKIAHLARLEVRPDEEAELLATLGRVLDWMQQLNELDTTGVEPLVHLTEAVNVLRPDEPRQTLTQAQALAAAPRHDAAYFLVPRVLE